MTFLSRIAATALAAGLSLSASTASAQIELRISSASPPASALVSAFELIKERVETAHAGAVKVSIHHSSSLFKQGTELPAMQRGNLEMATPVTFEIEQQLPEYGVLGKPYLFRDADHMIAVFRGEIGEQFRKDVHEKMGVVILDTGYLGTRTVGLSRARNVATPSDLAGVKMRMPPGPAFQNLATALGASPVSMPATEVYLALKTGSIDAQENPLNMARDWKFDEQTAEFVLTRHLVQPVFFAIGGKAWDRLTPDQQATLQAAAREAADLQIAITKADEAAAREQFTAAGTRISEPDLTAFAAAVEEVYARPGATKGWMDGLAERIAAVE